MNPNRRSDIIKCKGCPVCGSNRTRATSPKKAGDYAVGMACDDCGSTWIASGDVCRGTEMTVYRDSITDSFGEQDTFSVDDPYGEREAFREI